MTRVLMIALLVIAVWTALEIYTKGLNRAFDGFFADVSSELEAPADHAAPDRAADAFQRAWNKSETRVEEQLREVD